MSTVETVIHILENCLGKGAKGKVQPEDSLFDDLKIDGDSFDEFLAELEDHFEIIFEEDDIDTFDTANDIVAFIENHQKR